MSPSWNRMSPQLRNAAVQKLLDDGQAPSIIAFKLKAPRDEVERIARLIRREESQAKASEDNGRISGGAAPTTGEVSRQRQRRRDSQERLAPDSALVAQRIEQEASNLSVAGSSPAERATVDAPPIAPAAEDIEPQAVLPWAQMSSRQKEAAVLPLAKIGLSAAVIAGKLGIESRNSIITVIGRLQKAGQLPPPRTPTEQRGSLAQMAHVRRLKEQQAPKHRKPSKALAHLPGGAPKVNQFDFKARAEQRAESKGIVISRAAAFDPIMGTTPISMLDLGAMTCRWPVSGIEPVADRFCGQACEVEHSYCGPHRSLAYQTPSQRQQAGPRSAERMR